MGPWRRYLAALVLVTACPALLVSPAVPSRSGEGVVTGAGGSAESRGDWDRGRQPPTPSARDASATRAGEDAQQWELARGLKKGSAVGVEAWRRGSRSPRLPHSGGGSTSAAHDSRNWCAYVLTRIATSVVTNGTEAVIGPVSEPCPWGTCAPRHTLKEMTRPTYRIKHSIVTSLQWKCCPGHAGPACDLTGHPRLEEAAVGTAALHEQPPLAQRAHDRQSDEHDDDTIPGVTAQLLLGLKGKTDAAGSVWGAPHWGAVDDGDQDGGGGGEYGKDVREHDARFEQRESRSVAHGHAAARTHSRTHSGERKVTLDSVSEELVIDLVRKLLDERLSEASRRPGHGAAPEELQLLHRSLSALNDSVSERLGDLSRRVHDLERAAAASAQRHGALLQEQRAQRAAGEAALALASELRDEIGRASKLAGERLDAVNATVAGLLASAAAPAVPAVPGSPASPASPEISNNAAAGMPAADGPDGGVDGGSDGRTAKAAAAHDFGRFNETLKRHEYLLRDVYNQLHLFTETLKELSYRIQDEQEASWGERAKLQDACRAGEDSLSVRLLEVHERLLDMNKTLAVGLSPVEERFGSVLAAVRNLSAEVGHLQEGLRRRADATDWLDEARSLRERTESLVLSVQSLKIDVEDLKFSRSVLGPGARPPVPEPELESRLNGTEGASRRALEQASALGLDVSRLQRRVEQLSALGLGLGARADAAARRIELLNDSFSTLMEDTLRHTLALEELGVFRDSEDYDEYDGGEGGARPDAKVELNLVTLSRLLSQTAGAVREQSDVLLATRSRLLALQLQVANATAVASAAAGHPRLREPQEAPDEEGGDAEGRAARLWDRLGRLERAWLEMDGQRFGHLESRLNEMAGVAAGCLDRTDALREEMEREAGALQRTLGAVAASRDAEMEALRRDLLAELSAYVEAAMRARRKDKDERRQQRKETVAKQRPAGKAPAAVHGAAGPEPGDSRMPGFAEPAHLTEAARRGARQLTRAKTPPARTTWSIGAAPRPDGGTPQRRNAP